MSLAEYERAGGYRALRKGVKMAPMDVQHEVVKSDLRGRGGAGFSTGRKWSFVSMDPAGGHPKYFCVNADEMEPGTMKDRLLMEGDPHLLIEGTIISSYAVGADVAYIFLRGEYHLSHSRLATAIAEARVAGFIGPNVLGSGWGLDIRLHASAGRYMCGEETGLLNALEGKRAIPRSKPPYPQVCGLWGRPTVVNNVETVCCVPSVVANGGEWFKGLAVNGAEGGTKIFGVSGRVKRPGLWELPMGTPVHEVLDGMAGGMAGGYGFRGLLPGGASTSFITAEHLHAPLGFAAMEAVGSRLGTGTMIVMDDRSCPVGTCLSLEKFFARESCGWCTPCREGLPWIVRTLDALETGNGAAGDLAVLDEHVGLLAPGNTFCALAPGAMDPLRGALKYFRDDFQKHIDQKRCPYRTQ